MVVFDKSNVHFMWDDSLIGRSCYYADSIIDLVNIVTIQDEKDIGIVTNFGDIDEPFVIDMKNSYSIIYPTDVKNENSYSKDFVKFEWDHSLEGKKCLMANSIQEIKSMVLRNASPRIIFKTGCNENPFKDIDDDLYKFAYYDPYYNFRYALLNGEPIEYLADDGLWCPLQNCVFNLPIHYYRFKYEASLDNETKKFNVTPTEKCRIVTHRELTKWLATGHGQVRSSLGDNLKMYVVSLGYSEELDDKPVENVLVRTWDDVAWHLPTASYLGLDK